MNIEVSIDDGHKLDLRVIEILDSLKMKGVFYIPINSWGFENIDVYKNHIVGCHTWTHPMDMKLLDNDRLDHEIADAKVELEKKLGYPVRKFCFPRGRYDDRVIARVKKHGFKSARTTRVLDTSSGDFIEHTAIHVFSGRKEYSDKTWYQVACNLLQRPNISSFRVWGHSEEMDRNNEFDNLYKFLLSVNENLYS